MKTNKPKKLPSAKKPKVADKTKMVKQKEFCGCGCPLAIGEEICLSCMDAALMDELRLED